MLYDHRGQELRRVNRFGYQIGPPEFTPAEKPAGELTLVDAIASERIELEEEEEDE